jgi:transposase-like protein
MSKARLIITAVVVEGRSKSEAARDYDFSRQWVHHLVKRYQVEGQAAFEPLSPRSQTSTSPPQPPAVSTNWRILTRRGFVTAQPHKRVALSDLNQPLPNETVVVT